VTKLEVKQEVVRMKFTKYTALLLCLALLFAYAPLPEASAAPHTVLTSTTWTGVVDMSEGFYIAPTATLTIAPGTIIKMGGNIGVKGTIIAIGSESDPIVFTSAQENKKPGDWGFIEFPDTCGKSMLSNVIFEYGGKGSWGTVKFSSGNGIDDRVRLDSCTVRHSASQGIWMASAQAVIRECTVTDCNDSRYGVGIWIQQDSNPSITSCTIQRCNTAIWTDLSSNPHMLGNKASDCGYNGIVLGSGSIDKEIILDATLPYIIKEKFIVGKTGSLLIQKGAVIKTSSLISVYGNLNIRGTADEPIYWTSLMNDSIGGDTNGDGSTTTAKPGDWGHIELTGDAGECLFTNVNFSYGGGLGDQGAGWATIKFGAAGGVDKRIKMFDCEITYSQTAGIWMQDSSPSIYNCKIKNNTNPELGACVTLRSRSKPIIYNCELTDSTYAIITDSSSYPSVYDLKIENNRYNVIYFQDQEVTSQMETDTIWNSELVHYIPDTIGIKQGVTLRLMPGVVVKYGDLFSVFGKIIAIGSEDKPIIFTCLTDDAHGGDSNGDENLTKPEEHLNRGVQCAETEGLSVFKNCKFLYGGSGNYGTIHLGQAPNKSNKQVLINCEIRHSLGAGVTVRSGDVGLLNCSISDCANKNSGWALRAEREAKITLINTKIERCTNLFNIQPEVDLLTQGTKVSEIGTKLDGGYAGIYIRKGRLKDKKVWNAEFPYILDESFTIDKEGNLTLEAGNVIKTNGSFYIAGTFNTKGTAEAPVYITSISDDTAGGDSNVNDTNTLAKPGDLGQIEFDGSCGDCTLEHTVIRYAGGETLNGALKIGAFTPVDERVKIKNCTIEKSASSGIASIASSPEITDCVVRDCTTETKTGIGIKVTSNKLPMIERINFDNCDYSVENITGNDLWVSDSWWGDASGPFNEDWNSDGTGIPALGPVLFDPPRTSPIETAGAGGKGGDLPEWKAPVPLINEMPVSPITLNVEPKTVKAKVGTMFELAAVNGQEPYEFKALDESVCKKVSQTGAKATFEVKGSEATIIEIKDASDQIAQVWVSITDGVLKDTKMSASPVILPIRVGKTGTFRINSSSSFTVTATDNKVIKITESNAGIVTVYAQARGDDTIKVTSTTGEKIDLKVICWADEGTENENVYDVFAAPGDGKARIVWKLPNKQLKAASKIIITMNGNKLTEVDTNSSGLTVKDLKNNTEYTFGVKVDTAATEVIAKCTPNILNNTIILWIGKNKAFVNGNEKIIDSNPSVVPQIVGKGSTVIPFRFLAESLGASVGWNGSLREVSFWTPSSYLKIYIDKTNGYMWDTKVTVDPAPMIVGGRTLIPLRAVSELLGAKVGWDGAEKKITISYTRPWFDW